MGCGKQAAQGPVVYPVVGQVLVDGKPAARAEVTLHALGSQDTDSARPFAIVEDNGEFRPSTWRANDGAPPGEYAVTVVWPKTQKMTGGEEDRGEDQLRGRYASPQQPAAKVAIVAGENQLPPIQLKSR